MYVNFRIKQLHCSMFKIAFLILFPIQLFAQIGESALLAQSKPDNDYGFIPNFWYQPFFNSTWVYSKPDFAAKPFTKLTQYTDSVKVVEVLTSEKPIVFKGMLDHWLKVNFPFKGGYFVGYIPGHSLARTRLQYQNLSILYHTNQISGDTVFGSFKLLKGNIFLQEFSFRPEYVMIYNEYDNPKKGSFMEADYKLELYTGKGLDSCDFLLNAIFSISPCGTSNEKILFRIYNNKIMNRLITYYAYDDEGYYENRKLYTSSELGKENHLCLTRKEISSVTDSTYTEHHDSLIYELIKGSLQLKDSFFYNSPASVPY